MFHDRVFVIDWGIFFPCESAHLKCHFGNWHVLDFYFQLFAVLHGVNPQTAFYCVCHPFFPSVDSSDAILPSISYVYRLRFWMQVQSLDGLFLTCWPIILALTTSEYPVSFLAEYSFSQWSVSKPLLVWSSSRSSMEPRLVLVCMVPIPHAQHTLGLTIAKFWHWPRLRLRFYLEIQVKLGNVSPTHVWSFTYWYTIVRIRFGIAFSLTSVGALMGNPIDGALLGKTFPWIRPITFSGVILASVPWKGILINTNIGIDSCGSDRARRDSPNAYESKRHTDCLTTP